MDKFDVLRAELQLINDAFSAALVCYLRDYVTAVGPAKLGCAADAAAFMQLVREEKLDLICRELDIDPTQLIADADAFGMESYLERTS